MKLWPAGGEGGGWRGGGGERALQIRALMAIPFGLHAYNRQQTRATNANQQYELLEYWQHFAFASSGACIKDVSQMS